MNLFRPILCALLAAVFFAAHETNAQAAANAQANTVYLKAFYALDEPRFHCVDIPGHKARVNTQRPLVVHTCKEGIWHKDELFDPAALAKGWLRMPEYDLCVISDSTEEGAKLSLQDCGSPLGAWTYANYRLRLKAHPKMCLTIGLEPSKLTRGGQRLPSRHTARSLQLSTCSDETFQRQLWRFEKPMKRSGSVMPFQ